MDRWFVELAPWVAAYPAVAGTWRVDNFAKCFPKSPSETSSNLGAILIGKKLMAGCYLGYRKMTPTSDGNWSARYLDAAQKLAKNAPLSIVILGEKRIFPRSRNEIRRG